MKNYSELEIEKIQDRFAIFAEQECKSSSAFYYDLSLKISKDEELSRMASYACYGQPIPNIFFGAVHYLVLKDKNCQLASYYPSITKSLKNPALPFDVFKDFCIHNESQIVELISSKIVQTNVINRCSYLTPILSELINKGQKNACVIDIGASVGLNLNFDLYEYWTDGQKIFGDSSVKIEFETKDSAIKPILPTNYFVRKIGIDQHLINPQNEDEKLWLNALIWPDHLERFNSMEKALELRQNGGIEMLQASTVPQFEEIINEQLNNETLIIYSTHTLYQFSQENRQDFFNMLDSIGRKRDFYFLSVESTKYLQEKYDSSQTVIELTSYTNRQKNEQFIAETNGHGNWILWKNEF
ncbi:MAG: DUF2332 domain-containing protein [Chitinophagales bacterium]|nr:DUF2332 domain-containing protein [Sphingobacteriales bacterium]